MNGLVDQFGRPLERERLRKGAGFREQMLRADEPETITFGVPAARRGRWNESGDSVYWRDIESERREK